MESSAPLGKRLTVLVGIFLFILISGVASMHIFGGSTGNLALDFYLILSLFAFEGNWVFDDPSNTYLKALAFLAPLLTVLGVIELFTRRLVTHGLQKWTLTFIRDQVVIFGLNENSFMLLEALKKGNKTRHLVVIDQDPDLDFSDKCRKLGVPVIKGDPSVPETLAKAKISRASLGISFLPETSKAVSLVFAIDAKLRFGGKKSLDLWLQFNEPEFGRRLGDYLKFANLSERVHPRFFSLNEVAARWLVRQHPPDIYADVLGHEQLHVAIYGFGNFAFEILEEIILQSSSSFSKKPKVTILSPTPKEQRNLLYALCPPIDDVAEVKFQELNFYVTGLAEEDYDKIPEKVTMHIITEADPNKASAMALTLRQLLLTTPAGVKDRINKRSNAPIFVGLKSTKGITQLLEPHYIENSETMNSTRRGDIPDGIFAFGMKEDLLTMDLEDPMIPTVVDLSREKVAQFFHFSYAFDLETLKGVLDDVDNKEVARDWENLGPAFRESCRQEADHLWPKARMIRHRLEPKTGENVPKTNLTKKEKLVLAKAEHTRWMTERRISGWSYNKNRVDEAKRHNLLKPWEDLSEKETKMDLGLAEKMSAAADHAGLTLKRELIIGVVGHRFAPGRPFDVAYVKEEMSKAFDKIIAKNPDRSPVLMTHLADGADTIAAEVAMEKNIPFHVPLPLPFETYRKDFTYAGEEAVNAFLDLITKAEFYFELPLVFGDLVDLGKPNKDGGLSKAREHQYALGGAFVAERADELIAVWDGKQARGTGGTGDVVAWRKAGKVPDKYKSKNLFSRHTKIKPPIIIKPTRN